MENPPAFPRNASDCEAIQGGMTLRDWFAGQALAGCVADNGSGKPVAGLTASEAYAIADAMLAERFETGGAA